MSSWWCTTPAMMAPSFQRRKYNRELFIFWTGFLRTPGLFNRQGAKHAKVSATDKYRLSQMFAAKRHKRRKETFNSDKLQTRHREPACNAQLSTRFNRQDAKDAKVSATDKHRLSQMLLSAFHLSPSVARVTCHSSPAPACPASQAS